MKMTRHTHKHINISAFEIRQLILKHVKDTYGYDIDLPRRDFTRSGAVDFVFDQQNAIVEK